MLSASQVFRPKECLPSQEAIAAICRKAGYGGKTILLCDSSNSVIAFVKYGPTVDLSEARTQDWVSNTVNDDPRLNLRVPWVYMAFEIRLSGMSIWHIVMEYIDAPDCDANDFELAANAVQSLIGLKAQDAVPGPVGGGFIKHPFFPDDWCSNYAYDTVANLSKHINFILKIMGERRRVDLTAESKDGLYLCPSDITCGNLKKIKDGPVVVLDFGATCFLPPIFFYLAMHMSIDGFTRKISRRVEHPSPKSVDTMSMMLTVAGFLVQAGPKGVRVPLGFFD